MTRTIKLKIKPNKSTTASLFCILIGFSWSQLGYSKQEQVNYLSGDIVFQSSRSDQSTAIMWATKSLFSHVGVIEKRNNQLNVIEAISPVSRTPLKKWIARGRLSRFALYRDPDLTDVQRKQIVDQALMFLGRPYDPYFASESPNQAIYCSKLVYLAYEGAGIKLGKWQKIKKLDFDNRIVKALFKKRYQQHPLCKPTRLDFESCWQKVLNDTLITPDGLLNGKKLNLVYTNYPW